MKLTMTEAKAHKRACDVLEKQDPLNADEQEFVLRHWHESQNSSQVTTLAGAFFTPLSLAHDFGLEVGGARIIDLGAGIGTLSWAARRKLVAGYWNPPPIEFVCVERNPEYVSVGRKVLPEAEWICGDLFDLPADFRHRFDFAIANPPFGRTPRTGRGPRYTGRCAEYHVIDVAADLARHGVFLVPQTSAPFRYSGTADHRWERTQEYLRFERQTGIELQFNCGIDTAAHTGWRGVRPTVEIVTCDFTERRNPLPPSLPDGQLSLLTA